jgi:hypothetical protein
MSLDGKFVTESVMCRDFVLEFCVAEIFVRVVS